MADNDLNEVFNETMIDSTVITVPIDDTLSNSGEAADAKAVGDALALKADASSVNTIDVNGQAADNQGHIILDATEIPMSSADSRNVQAVVSGLEGLTGADIPLNSETGAPSIADAIGGQYATEIPMSSSDETTVAEKIAEVEYIGNANANDIALLKVKTAAQIEMSATDDTTVKEAIEERVKTVNGNSADENGNVEVTRVSLADNLTSSSSQTVEEAFIERTSGGNRSVETGSAWLTDIKGYNVHTGYTAESLTHAETLEDGSGITAVAIDRDDWVAEVSTSGTYTFLYSGGWTLNSESVNLASYGITVTGSPASGDQIAVTYVAEVRGTITVANPQAFSATGYNLYDHSVQRARVLKYSETYGFGISGDYTSIKYAATVDGAQTTVTVTDGQFQIAADGYIFLTGGNATNTRIWMTWSDWSSAYVGANVPFAAYEANTISLTSIMSTYFPNGLMKAGTVADEIDLDTGYVYPRIERLSYSAENRAAAEASGRAYEYDENYIYLEKASVTPVQITINGAYQVNDHGTEFYSGTSAPVHAYTVYGVNLKNKLERDVLTISAQTLTSAQQGQARTNIGAASQADLTALNSKLQKNAVSVSWENGKTPTFETTSAIAGIVLFSVYYSSISFTTSWVTIGQLPSGYYPAEGLYLMSGLGAGKYMYISNTGVIMIKADSAASNALASFNIAYAI